MKEDLHQQLTAAAHARYWNLLPWWINGTLSPEDVQGLEQHVAECSACADEANVQRSLLTHIRSDAVRLAPQNAWEKMVERLDSEDETIARSRKPRNRSAVRGIGVHGMGLWAYAVAAQAVLIVGLGFVVWRQASMPTSMPTSMQVDASNERRSDVNVQASTMMQPRYQTLTSATDAPAQPGNVRVVFRQDVTLADVSTLLVKLSAQAVAGPSEAGVYTLALRAGANASGNSKATANLLRELRADDRVVFAEPAVSLP